MTFEQLNYVIEVSKTGSINKAAANLFVSQSSLSQAIQNLERELGYEIFTRTRHGVVTTPYGKTFISYLIPIQLQFKQLQNISTRESVKPTVTFSLANDGFHQPSIICTELFNKYCSIGIRLEQYDSYGNEARDLVANGIAEIGVIRMWNCYKKMELRQFETRDLVYHPIYEAELGISIGPHNPLFESNPTFVTPDMLSNYPMIQYSYLDSGPFSDIISKLGLPMNKSTAVTSSRTVIDEMLEHTDAYYLNSLWPDMRTQGERIRTIPLRGTDIRSELGWIAKKGKPMSLIASEFTELLEQRMREP